MDVRLLRKSVKLHLLNTSHMRDRCSVQGFGMFRFRIDDNTRVHVWHPYWRTENVSDIHDHLQWHFTSTVLRGQITNETFEVMDEKSAKFAKAYSADSYDAHRIVAGENGGHAEVIATELVLRRTDRRYYATGESYSQLNYQIHRSSFSAGAISIIAQSRDAAHRDSATVFVPHGEPWVDAKPRQATFDDFEMMRDLIKDWQV